MNRGKDVGVVDEMDVEMGVDVGVVVFGHYLIPVFCNCSPKFT